MNGGDGRETGCFCLSIVLSYNQIINSYLSESAGPHTSLPFPGHHLISAAVVMTASQTTLFSDGNPCPHKIRACAVVPAAPYSG